MGFIGLYGGLAFAILGWFFGRRQAKKENGLDEMNSFIFTKARSISWYFTIVTIYVLFSLALLDIELSLIFALAILLFVHMGSWAISAIVMSIRLSSNPENIKEQTTKKQIILSGLIGGSILLFFTIMSAATGNWKFLLVAIPPALVSSLTLIYATHKQSS